VTADNDKPAQISVARRLKVVVPCLAVLLMMMTWIASGLSDRGNWPLGAKVWLSLISGPLACWIELGGHFTLGDKVFLTIMAFVLVPGILSHAIWPRRFTAAVTILSSVMWFLWSSRITCAGV